MKSISSRLMRLMSIGVLSIICTLALLVCLATAADQFRRINTVGQKIDDEPTTQVINLTIDNKTSLTINCPTPPCKISILYNAECIIQSLDTIADFLSIRILVDDQAVPPTQDLKRFCTSQVTLTPTPAPTTGTIGSFSTQAGATLTTAGPHTIQLLALPIFSHPSEAAFLFDSSIIVIRTP